MRDDDVRDDNGCYNAGREDVSRVAAVHDNDKCDGGAFKGCRM